MRCISVAAVAVFAAASVMAPTMVSATECSDEQLDVMTGYDFTPLDAACPEIFAREPKIPKPGQPETITKESLAVMSSCKTKQCITELTKFADWLLDCTRGGMSDKRMFRATITLCKAFNDGDVTIPMATDIFAEVTKNASELLAKDLANGSGNGTSTAVTPTPVVSSSKSPTRCKIKK